MNHRVVKLQAEDESLERARKLAKQKDNTEFQIRQGLVYRIRTNRDGVESKQLAVPTKLRQQVMTHDTSPCWNYEWTSRSS